MTSVTPVFDKLAVEWTEEGLPLPFKLIVIPDISQLGEQAALDEKLGTLPLLDSWEPSFHGEYLDFGDSGPHRVLHERSDDRQADEDDDVELPSGNLSTDALAELKEGPAHVLLDSAIIYLFDASDVNFDSWHESVKISAFDNAIENLAEGSEDEPTAREVMQYIEQRRLSELEDGMKDRAMAKRKKPPSLIKKASEK